MSPDPFHREYFRWFSPHLGRDMELLIFGHGGTRVLFFPTRCGRFYDYENFGVIHKLSYKLSQGWLQLFCVDSIDHESYYADWSQREDRILRHMAFERYIFHEVVPFTEKLNSGSYFISAGCSMGGYHAANFGFRYPDLVNKIIAMGGRHDLTQPTEEFRDLLDGHHNEDVYYHMPAQYMANLSEGTYLNQLREQEVVLAVGEEDPFLESNRYLASLLERHSIPHILHVWGGRAHSRGTWRRMVDVYL